jgi:hypothetical protein
LSHLEYGRSSVYPRYARFSSWALWLGFWSLILGQWLSGLFPDYEIVALHFTFLGGFSTITLIVSIHVIASHCGPESLWDAPAKAMKGIGILLLAALVSRLLSGFMDWYYFGMLHVAAGFWMAAAIVWMSVYGWRVIRVEETS